MGRTLQTAEIALRDVLAEPKIVPELAEISVDSWEGLRRGEIEKLEPRFANSGQSDRFEVYCNSPGGESYAAFSTCIRLVLEALQRPTVIVAHGIVGRVLCGLWLGLERGQLAGLPGGRAVYFISKKGAKRCFGQADQVPQKVASISSSALGGRRRSLNSAVSTKGALTAAKSRWNGT